MLVLERILEGNTLSFGIDQLKAWWNCHTERIKFIYSSAIQENRIKSLSNLRFLYLTSCNKTNGALSECLFGLNSLEELQLHCIMSLTTLPSEDILRNLKCLRILRIYNCWLLQSLGSLYAFSSLEELEVSFCPCLDLKKENNPNFGLPSSLQSLKISLCSISSDILKCNLPDLSTLGFQSCRSPPSLSIGHFTSLISLKLVDCRDICFLEGLQLLCNLEELRLTQVPKLEVKKSVLESWPGCRESLYINSMQWLKILLSLDAFFPPRMLFLEHIEEEAISLDSEFESEGSVLYQKLGFVERLHFFKCKTKCLPTSLRNVFSSLKLISFQDCPKLSSLPELPESITGIEIKGCPVLKERCRYNGEDWPKIAHIRWKDVA
ncbi:Rp1-like protein [Rhynchospora pubera]|uniref:Rp1-like protein n=1 Tax=Rhynchospora pubera TaxID=906938 RepID=A0AAV8GQI8_9POAL|nr:Rp1-like protein [Rhynchospora pubera]